MTQVQHVIKRAFDDQGKLVETLRYTMPINAHTKWMIQKFEYRHFIQAINRTITSTYQIEEKQS